MRGSHDSGLARLVFDAPWLAKNAGRLRPDDEMVWLNELVPPYRPGRGPVRVRDELLAGLRALIFLRAIRPGYAFFYNYVPTTKSTTWPAKPWKPRRLTAAELSGSGCVFRNGLNDGIKNHRSDGPVYRRVGLRITRDRLP